MSKVVKNSDVRYTITTTDGYPTLKCSLSVLGHIVLNRGPKALIKIHRSEFGSFMHVFKALAEANPEKRYPEEGEDET